MLKLNTIVLTVSILFTFVLVPFAQGQSPNQYEIVKQEHAWNLLRNGESFYIKGAVAGRAFDMLCDYGANSLRTRARKNLLDRANQYDFSVMANLPVRGERSGLDWGNEEQVSKQLDHVIEIVKEFKDYPAVMFWSIGNELDWIPPGRPHHPELWDRLNDIAKAIKKIDPHHPVMTVVGSGRFERKVKQLVKDCPDMDLLGINTYGDIAEVTELARQYWPKPYVISEWGPTGHWQVPDTEWGVPIEQTSSEKARVIYDRYTQIIQADKEHCLGSYVFYWAEKQETTHTWYGLFRDGMKTEPIDVMKLLWSGSWPTNRAPALMSIEIDGCTVESAHLKPEETYEAEVWYYDPDYDILTFEWDIRPEVEIPENSYAGGGEKPAEPIPGLIVSEPGKRIRFKTPSEEGAYRLFVQIEDNQGSAGYGNVPFLITANKE